MESQKIAPPSNFSLNLKELWSYRELLYFFMWRDIKVRYKQTVLGFLWAILQPTLMMLVFTFVFSYGLKVSSDNIPYPIFVYSALLIWNIFAQGLKNGCDGLIEQSDMIRKIYFPRLIIPLSTVLTAFFDYLVASIVYILLFLYFQYSIDVVALFIFLPAALVLTIITTFGASTLFAAFNIKYRDFRYIIPYMIQIFFFINPIVYSLSSFQKGIIPYLIALNPMAGAINLSRHAFINEPLRIDLLSISVLSALLLLFIGIYNFRKTEAYFADMA